MLSRSFVDRQSVVKFDCVDQVDEVDEVDEDLEVLGDIAEYSGEDGE